MTDCFIFISWYYWLTMLNLQTDLPRSTHSMDGHTSYVHLAYEADRAVQRLQVVALLCDKDVHIKYKSDEFSVSRNYRRKCGNVQENERGFYYSDVCLQKNSTYWKEYRCGYTYIYIYINVKYQEHQWSYHLEDLACWQKRVRRSLSSRGHWRYGAVPA